MIVDCAVYEQGVGSRVRLAVAHGDGDMPKLRWRLGYPLALTLILIVCLTLFRYFHRIDRL